MLIIVLVIILLLWWFFVNYNRSEAFDMINYGLPNNLDDPRFGLRGDRLYRRDIASSFISPYRNIRLSASNGVMWESSMPPTIFDNSCHRAQCPQNTNEYDSMDTCWKCDRGATYQMRVPYVWNH